jgi:hypothetical protein
VELDETARVNVRAAIEGLSDPEYQRRVWGRVQKGSRRQDDLSMAVHILYDDFVVLPDPAERVGWALYPSEVDSFVALDAVFGPLLVDTTMIGKPDSAYQSDPRWPAVVAAARVCLVAMDAAEAAAE